MSLIKCSNNKSFLHESIFFPSLLNPDWIFHSHFLSQTKTDSLTINTNQILDHLYRVASECILYLHYLTPLLGLNLLLRKICALLPMPLSFGGICCILFVSLSHSFLVIFAFLILLFPLVWPFSLFLFSVFLTMKQIQYVFLT